MDLARRLLIATLSFGIALGGCSSGAEAPTRYDDSSKMAENKEVPWNKAWFADGWNDRSRSSIVIAPVDTKLVQQTKWWKEAKKENKLDELSKDLNDLAAFTREEFQKSFREDEKKRFSVVNSPQSGSVIMELAIVDVEPNEAKLGALGLAATLLAAPFGVAILAKEAAKGGVAMEGRLKDAKTGEVIAMWADREKGKFAPISVARATSFGEVQRSIREWSEQWVKVANAAPGEKVGDVKRFTLRPW